MATQFHRPNGLKYTDMCIYIDNNIDKIVNNGEYPEVETKIYEYLYHILYALSCKENYFVKFEDYEYFSLYGAGELFMTLRTRKINAGKVIRGKEVVPIKSCLNFIKSVLFPLKINYQRQSFATIINPEIDQDTSILDADMKAAVMAEYQKTLQEALMEVLDSVPIFLDKIVRTTPYRNDEDMVHKLKISCLLTLNNSLCVPKKYMKKLSNKTNNLSDSKLIDIYRKNANEVVLWHLPEILKDYVKILTIRLKHKITDEINITRHADDLSDEILDSILKTAYSHYEEGEY